MEELPNLGRVVDEFENLSLEVFIVVSIKHYQARQMLLLLMV